MESTASCENFRRDAGAAADLRCVDVTGVSELSVAAFEGDPSETSASDDFDFAGDWCLRIAFVGLPDEPAGVDFDLRVSAPPC